MNHTEWTEHKIYSGARTVFLKIMHLMFFNEVSKFNRRLISNISCSESQIVVKLKLTQIETQLRLMSKIRPIAFWKYLYTRHTQNSIGEIFKFLEYFLSMYSIPFMRRSPVFFLYRFYSLHVQLQVITLSHA